MAGKADGEPAFRVEVAGGGHHPPDNGRESAPHLGGGQLFRQLPGEAHLGQQLKGPEPIRHRPANDRKSTLGGNKPLLDVGVPFGPFHEAGILLLVTA